MSADVIDLEELIDGAYGMDPLSPTAVRLAELVGDPNYYMDDLVEVISFDQVLTLKLLRAANSAASGTSVRVDNVKDAVARMGIAQVLALTVASKVRPLLQTHLPAYELEEGGLWRHSVAAAICAEILQEVIRFAAPPETFTAALLHDVGKLIMGRYLSPETLTFIRRAKEADHLSQMEAESLLLNVHHAELGGLVAQHWNLSPRIIRGIAYHHDPDQAEDVICDLTYVSNRLAKYVEAELSGHKIELVILPSVAERLALSPKILEILSPIVTTRYTRVTSRYNAV